VLAKPCLDFIGPVADVTANPHAGRAKPPMAPGIKRPNRELEKVGKVGRRQQLLAAALLVRLSHRQSFQASVALTLEYILVTSGGNVKRRER
jgi:hypothetical protein